MSLFDKRASVGQPQTPEHAPTSSLPPISEAPPTSEPVRPPPPTNPKDDPVFTPNFVAELMNQLKDLREGNNTGTSWLDREKWD